MNKQDMRASARIAAGARGLAPVDALPAIRLLSAMMPAGMWRRRPRSPRTSITLVKDWAMP